MSRLILAPFAKFAVEGATVGRLLAGYSNLEIGLMNCVQMARGNDFDTVLKKMFSKRGETRRIDEAQKLFVFYHRHYGLLRDFQKAIRLVRYCLKIRNQYAHGVWWDDYSGKLVRFPPSVFRVLEHIRNMDNFALQRGTPRCSSSLRRKLPIFHVLQVLAGEADPRAFWDHELMWLYLKAYQAQKAVHDQEARMQLMVALGQEAPIGA